MRKIKVLLVIGTLLATVTDCTKPETSAPNNAPEIEFVTTSSSSINSGATASFKCKATDKEDDELTYFWSATGGTLDHSITSEVSWTAPEVAQDTKYTITCTVIDGKGNSVSDYCSIMVLYVAPDPVTITLNAIEDTYVYSALPDKNYGGSKALNTGSSYYNIDDVYMTYIKFDLSSIPVGTEVEKLELAIVIGYSYNSPAIKGDINIYQIVSESWNEYQLTYNNKPSKPDNVIGVMRDIVFNSINQEKYDLTYTADLTNSNYFSIMLNASGYYPSDECYIYSREEQGYGATLKITYYPN